MPLSDVLAAALSRPAGRVVEGPVRTIVQEVLQDHGYAGPAEVQSLRDEIAALRDTVAALTDRVDAAEKGAASVSAQAGELLDALGRAAAAVSEARADARAAREEAAMARDAASPLSPLDPSPPRVVGSSACKVPDCGRDAARSGFCQTHVDAWRSGSLDGYVGPEGLVQIGDAAYAVDAAYAGQAFTLTKGARPRVRVAGKAVRKTPL